MIDLHIHTNNSDGTDTVQELLRKAELLKLKYISITDHDTCKGYKELENIDFSKIFSGKIIPGIEIKCAYKKRIIEVLGYNIDTSKMQKWLDDFYKDKKRSDLQRKYFNTLYDKCIKLGFKLTDKEKIVWNPNNDWASFTIYTDIKKHSKNESIAPKDMWEEFSNFNRKYCANPEHILYIDKTEDYPSLEMAINVIKQSNGLVFMPHLFIYKWVGDKKEFIEELVNNYDIDGLECYYTDFKDEETKYLLDLCDKNGLLKSGGSDYHGLNKAKIFLAKGYGNLEVPDEIVENWI